MVKREKGGVQYGPSSFASKKTRFIRKGKKKWWLGKFNLLQNLNCQTSKITSRDRQKKNTYKVTLQVKYTDNY